jgi:hypothetical protein
MKYGKLLFLPILLSGCTPTYLIKGEGSTTCSVAINVINNQPQLKETHVAWLNGYITRYNYEHNVQSGKGFSNEALIQTAAIYCQKNPLHDFALAANSVVAELEKK